MLRTYPKIILLIVLCPLPLISYTQTQPDSAVFYRVETRDGNEYTGTIISRDTAGLILQTRLGKLTFTKKDITRIIRIDPTQIKKGEYWSDNPQSTRYLWAPNGYGLKKGEAYYQNILVLFNQVSVGVTDYFSIGAGFMPLFLFGGGSTPVWLTPKFSIPVKKDKFNVGAGALLAKVLGEEESGFGLVYGITTFGSRDRNISLGLGYGYAGNSWAKTPTISLSGMIRTGARGYLITENYFIDAGENDNLVMLSAGFRWVIKKAGLDFGLFMPLESSLREFIAIPWLGITIPFGKTQVR